MSRASDQLAQTFVACKPLFFALSEIPRQQILLLLSEQTLLNVNQIADCLPLSRPAVSHHLKILREAGLVTVQQRGTENLHALSTEAAVSWLARCAEDLASLSAE